MVRGLIGGLASGLIAGHVGCRGIVREREVYLDLYISSDRFSVQQVRPVLPLLDRCDGCRGEHGMSADQLDVFDVAGIAHDHLQPHHALNARLSGERRVNGINLRYQQVGCDFGGDVYRLRRSFAEYPVRQRAKCRLSAKGDRSPSGKSCRKPPVISKASQLRIVSGPDLRSRDILHRLSKSGSRGDEALHPRRGMS